MLRHTTADPDNEFWLPTFAVVEVLESIDNLRFRVFPYRAGIDEDDICVVNMRHRLVSALCQDACHQFAVTDVHLAAHTFRCRRGARVLAEVRLAVFAVADAGCLFAHLCYRVGKAFRFS